MLAYWVCPQRLSLLGRDGSGNVLRLPMREQMGTNHYDIRTHLFFNVTTTLLGSAFCGMKEYHNGWGGNEVAGGVAGRDTAREEAFGGG